MKHVFLGIVLLAATAALLFSISFETLFSDVETKSAASEITEWVKLAVAVVTLLIGLINLRLALHKKDGDR